jgi:multiple sugar transport system substrate-binding protein
MRKNTVKLFVVFMCMIVFLSMLYGCSPASDTTTESPSASTDTGDQSNKEQEKVNPTKIETVKFFYGSGSYKTLVEQEVEKFNSTTGKEKGVKIELIFEGDKYRDVLFTLIQTGNSPDIFLVPTGIERQYINSKYITPLEDIPGTEELLERFKPLLINEMHVFDGKTYTLPFEVLPIKLAYNKDLFRKAGIVDAKGEPTPPKTWDEAAEYAKRITEKGEGIEFGYGHTWGFTVGWRRQTIKPFVASVGHFWFDNSVGKYDFSAFKPALEFVMQTKKDKSFFPGPESLNIDPLRAQFSEGRIGMMISPSYDVGVFNDQFPAKMDWGFADLPVVDPNNRYKEPMIYRPSQSISSSVTEERMPAVLEAYKFLHSKEYWTTLYENNAIIPAEVDIIANAKNVMEKKGWAEQSSNLDKAAPILPYPDSLLTVEGPTIAETLNNVWAGNLSIDEALADLDKRFNAALEKAVSEGKVNVDNYIIQRDITLK